jgi:hypothetical protein
MTKWQRFRVFSLESVSTHPRDIVMDLISSFSTGLADLAGFAQPVISFLKAIAESTGLSVDDSPGSWSGMLMSGAAGVAAALAVAMILMVYFRSGYRTIGDIAKHSLAAAVVLGLLAFVAYDMRDAALAYLGMNSSKPEVEFEIRLPNAAASAVADTQIELLTDQNQTLAQIERELARSDDGRSVLRGWVALDFRTTDRVVVLNQPGQPLRQFKLRLAANPSRSDQFGPWHLADRVGSPDTAEPPPNPLNDAFAIRYRVL